MPDSKVHSEWYPQCCGPAALETSLKSTSEWVKWISIHLPDIMPTALLTNTSYQSYQVGVSVHCREWGLGIKAQPLTGLMVRDGGCVNQSFQIVVGRQMVALTMFSCVYHKIWYVRIMQKTHAVAHWIQFWFCSVLSFCSCFFETGSHVSRLALRLLGSCR